MTFYFAMINAWSLAWEALYGDMDKEYPIIDTSVGAGNTAFEDDGLDYEIDLTNGASACLLYTSPSPRDQQESRLPSSA